MIEENPLAKVIDRLINTAMLYGTAFCKVTFNAETDMFNFNVILPEHVIITYEKKSDDK